MIIFQEIIVKLKPQFIIETGTGKGGSALFYASIMELLQRPGKVITIDIENKAEIYRSIGASTLWEKRIQQFIGNSVDNVIFQQIKNMVYGNIMVVLDSWHTKEHVLRELELYANLVSVGSYLIVEDTHVNSHPVPWNWGEGPFEAVSEFLNKRNDFTPDENCERFNFTFNPSGWLKKISKKDFG